MSKVYITGHRNPDLDSLCAALSYAQLKNLTDPENEYIPIRCSHVSDSVRKQMEVMELEIPEYKRDIVPKVRDVLLHPPQHFQIDNPIFELVHIFNTDKPSVVPVYEGDEFKGLLSVDEISGWFLADNTEEIPSYRFTAGNISKVLPGKFLHRGTRDEIEGSLLIGAADYDSFREFVDQYPECIVVTGMREDLIRYAVQKQVPGIIIAAVANAPEIDFSGYEGMVYTTAMGTAETIRRIRLAESVREMMGQVTETVQADDRFSDAKSALLNSRARGMAVFDKDKYVGFVTRRCFLEAPQHNVIMVDHNEPAQSIKGIETANVIEIIDHHRLDAVSTKMPIFIDAEPLGSTCTIVYQQYIRLGIMPDQKAARTMLTGIISDTLILRSPTTTARDISTVEMLARLAKVPSVEEFGEKLFSITDNLATQDPEPTILGDFKNYESAGVKMGIGQCEVTTLSNVGDYAEKYLDALEEIKEKQGLDWALLMITDVLREKSVLLVTDSKLNRELPYAALDEQIYNMPGVMSRKKQLLPTVISVTSR